MTSFTQERLTSILRNGVDSNNFEIVIEELAAFERQLQRERMIKLLKEKDQPRNRASSTPVIKSRPFEGIEGRVSSSKSVKIYTFREKSKIKAA